MEITQIMKYKVSGLEFDSLEGARAFLDKNTEHKEIYAKNRIILSEANLKYVPSVNKDGELCLWVNRFNNFDQGEGWENILGREHLRYFKETVDSVGSDIFIGMFINQAELTHVEVNDMKEVIAAIQLHLANVLPDYPNETMVGWHEKILDALGKIHYSPVYIHD